MFAQCFLKFLHFAFGAPSIIRYIYGFTITLNLSTRRLSGKSVLLSYSVCVSTKCETIFPSVFHLDTTSSAGISGCCSTYFPIMVDAICFFPYFPSPFIAYLVKSRLPLLFPESSSSRSSSSEFKISVLISLPSIGNNLRFFKNSSTRLSSTLPRWSKMMQKSSFRHFRL